MKNGNIIDLNRYRQQNSPPHDRNPPLATQISEELQIAIEHLIDRLRESRSIQQSH